MNAKRLTLILALTAAFGSTFAMAKPNCVTDPSGLVATCDETASGNEPTDNSASTGTGTGTGNSTTVTNGAGNQVSTPYGVGEMPYSVDRNGLVDKVNVVDVQAKNAYDHADDAYNSAGRAHERLDHDNDRLDAHAKSIGNLYDTKVDKTTFYADQKRQDDQIKDLQGEQKTTNLTLVSQRNDINQNSQRINQKADADKVQAALDTKVDTSVYDQGQAEQDGKISAAQATGEKAQRTAEVADSKADKAQVTANTAHSEAVTAQATAVTARTEAAAADSKASYAVSETERLDSVKASRSEVNQLNAQTNANAKGYAAQAESNANAYTDAKFKETDQKIKDVADKAYSGVALTEAMTALTPTVHADKSAIGVAVGTYSNHGAVAVGYSHRFTDDATTLRLNTGVSDRNFGAALGVTHEF